MNSRIILILSTSAALALASACTNGKAESGAGAPPPQQIEREQDGSEFSIEHPDQYPLATAGSYEAAAELNVNGVVSPDITRNIPVVSLASGRVVEVLARLGDTVKKGQALLRMQSQDIAQAFSDYQQATADESLAAAQLVRAKDLYAHGAIALNELQIAENADSKAKVTMATAQEHLHFLGANARAPSAIVEVRAPASGVITDQQVTNAAGVQGLGGPNPFTISDLSHVWILCDVYENDLPFVRLGEYADVHLNAYPDVLLKGRIGNIGPILDPTLRTAKVRLEVSNPGMLRIGMLASATFYAARKEIHASVPSTAVLHLHDHNWIYVPVGSGQFRRVEVTTGRMLAAGQQEILSGIAPGRPLVAKALDLQSTVEP